MVLSRSIKFKYIWDIAIYELNMVTSRVKDIESRADREKDFFLLSILGVRSLANYQKCL